MTTSILKLDAAVTGANGAAYLVAANRSATCSASVAWALVSLAAAIAGWGTPTTEGTVWIVLQALVVAGFAELQLTGLRRQTAALAR